MRPLAAIAPVGHARWLTGDRARAYGRLVGVAVLVFGLWTAALILRPAIGDPHGRPLASDFNAFWSGAQVALRTSPASVYDLATINAAEQIGPQPDATGFLPYVYPPVFLLLCLPLGLVGYLPAMVLFAGAGLLCVATCLRRILAAPWPFLPIMALPAAVLDAVVGQNGWLSAVCYAGALLLLDTRPILGGACMGLLAFKPHLAICVPVALVASRRWAALSGCAATSTALVLLSWLAFGSATWAAFARSLPLTGAMLQDPDTWPKLMSVFAALHLLGAGWAAAYAGQTLAASCALGIVAVTSRRRPGAGPEVATLVAASTICTPHILDYDLVCLGVPIAWLAREAASTGWRPWEKTVLAACYLLPLVARVVNVAAGLPTMPVAMACLLAVVGGRSRAMAPRPA